MSFGDVVIFATCISRHSACSRFRTTIAAPRPIKRRIEHVSHFESSVPCNALASQAAELVLPGRTTHSIWSRCRTLFISAQAHMVEPGHIGTNDRSHHQDAAQYAPVPHPSGLIRDPTYYKLQIQQDGSIGFVRLYISGTIVLDSTPAMTHHEAFSSTDPNKLWARLGVLYTAPFSACPQ
jgi:hypothetical protein